MRESRKSIEVGMDSGRRREPYETTIDVQTKYRYAYPGIYKVCLSNYLRYNTRTDANPCFVRGNLDLVNVRQSDDFNNLDQKTQQIIESLLDDRRAFSNDLKAQTMAISEMLNHTEVVIVDQTRELIFNVMQDQAYKLRKADNGNDIKTKTRSDEDRVEGRNWPAMDADIRQLRLNEQARRLAVEETILGGLRFPTMTDRHDGIVEAHERTFEWIFDMSSKETRWSNFIDWLRDRDGVYWVNGKAGSENRR